MADISKIDKNFAAHAISGGEFVSIDNPPFTIYGVEKDEGGYFRVPKEVAEKTNEGTVGLFRNTSGGVVRFRTNTKWFAIRAEEPVDCCSAAHLPPLGATGFDAYSGKHFLASFSPKLIPDTLLWEQPFQKCPTDEDGFFEVTLNMPLYGSYKRIYVKVDEDAEIRPAESTYRNDKPVVFYGSSITQGGCASTPGTSYTNILSRKLNLYCKNLGFSGSARGEEAMAEYIAGLEMSAFVFDYDYNAPTPEHLEKTHKRFFDIVRAKNPELPVIMISAIPFTLKDEENKVRREIIYNNYKTALAAGDKNVYFIDGGVSFFSEDVPFDDCTVDGCHPNSLGMFMMAKGIEKVLAPLFE